MGLEFGGAIGVVLFLAQAVSIAFYCIGFGEALAASPLVAAQEVSPRMIAAEAVCFLFVLAWLGAGRPEGVGDDERETDRETPSKQSDDR